MKLETHIDIDASPAKVWAGLHDPDLLKVCILGCTKLVWAKDYQDVTAAGEPKRLDAAFETQIGPVEIGLKGLLTLKDQVPCQTYILLGQGSGFIAGKAKGEAVVRLEGLDQDGSRTENERASNTRLHVAAGGSVSGLLSRLGGQMVKGVALKQMDIFLEKLKIQIEVKPSSPTQER